MKHFLLFSLFSFFIINYAFSQVPVNDLIQNATLVTDSPHVENNVRLDLASPSAGGQNGCTIPGYQVVYYKFTATDNVNLSVTVEDTRDLDMGQFFAIVFTAPDLNVTDESQLTIASSCIFGNVSNFPITTGTNYYVLVHRMNGATPYSRVTIDIPQDAPASEKAALLDLYNNTVGANWTSNTNWNTTEPASSWHGITINDGHVKKISLNNNNLLGTIPASLTTSLPFIQEINVSFNNLSGALHDFSLIPTLNVLNITGNFYSFQDLETNYSNNTTVSSFIYQSQRSTDTSYDIDGVIGNNYTLTMTPVNGTNVQYQWFKKRYNYFDPSDEPIAGANSNILNLMNLQHNDFDIYFCRATSSIITDLIIQRGTIEIKGPVSQADKDILIAIYNSTNGASWTNNTNWLSTEPVSTWYGVTVKGNKVTELEFSNNNLTGTLPPEIGDLTSLQYLSFYYGNSINGTLPPEIGNLTDLRLLSFEYNNFTGEIPASYANLTELRGFWFNNNQLSGEVPDFVATSYTNMTYFDISYNNFQGPLPDLSSLQVLRYVKIDNNHFYASDFANEFNDYLNLQASWNDSYYYSPQTTLDLTEYQSLTEGEDIILTVSESNARYGNTNRVQELQWYKDNTPISGANTNPYIITNAAVADSGSYHCIISDSDIPNFEVIRAPINVDVTLGIKENELQEFKLYPNPTNNVLYIKRPTNSEATINIYDINGRLILNQNINKTLNEINLSKFQSGMYVLEYKTDNTKIVKQIIKH